jgi:hypothetical protein
VAVDTVPIDSVKMRLAGVVQTKVYRSSAVTSIPLMPTVTDTVPETCAGVTAVITELLTRTTDVAAIPSKATVYTAPAGVKPEPLIVTAVPPDVVPDAGLTF